MPFPRRRPVWLTGETLDEPDLEAWDSALERTINARAGGAWDPTNRIVVGGAGVRIAGPSELDVVRVLKMTNGALVEYRDPGDIVERYIDLSFGVARPFPNVDDDRGWVLAAEAGIRPTWVSQDFGAPLVFQFGTPRGCVITSVTATLGAEPAITRAESPTIPSLVEITRQLKNQRIPFIESLASKRDVFVDSASYNAAHPVVVTPDEPIITDPLYRYGVRVHSEDGVQSGTDQNAYILQYFIALKVSTLQLQLDPFVK